MSGYKAKHLKKLRLNLTEAIIQAADSGSSEGRLIATFADDLRADGNGYALIRSSMDEIVGWAKFVKKSAR